MQGLKCSVKKRKENVRCGDFELLNKYMYTNINRLISGSLTKIKKECDQPDWFIRGLNQTRPHRFFPLDVKRREKRSAGDEFEV